MPKSHPPYPPEFRLEAVRLVRSGERTPEGLARDLGCSAQAIRNWVKQADLDEGRRSDDLTTATFFACMSPWGRPSGLARFFAARLPAVAPP